MSPKTLFRTYYLVGNLMQGLEFKREVFPPNKGTEGIAVDKDEIALEYQRLSRFRERLRSRLEQKFNEMEE